MILIDFFGKGKINGDTFPGKNIKRRKMQNNYSFLFKKKNPSTSRLPLLTFQHSLLIPCSLPIHSHQHACICMAFNQVT